MSSVRRMLVVATAGALVVSGLAAPAHAANFSPGPGDYVADTTTLTITGPGTALTGADDGGVAVFSFDNVNIPAGATVNVRGTRPFKLVASGALTVAGVIDASGTSASDGFAGPYPGGPGAGAGGADGTDPGDGTGGGGVASSVDNGAGGGGFGGAGARGGIEPNGSGTAGVGGVAYGDHVDAGSGGGGSGSGVSAAGGGGGGGAVQLTGSSVTVAPGGAVRADGGSGGVGGFGASGGGSGGSIVVFAKTLTLDGPLSARGGDGGAGGCCGDGGGGGGGRIGLFYGTANAITTDVFPGTSGAATDGNTAHGGLSPDTTGVAGVVTEVALCLVPKVKGMRLRRARNAIEAAHCAVGTITRAFSSRVPRGRVISQNPRQGTLLEPAAPVNLKVSKGPRPV